MEKFFGYGYIILAFLPAFAVLWAVLGKMSYGDSTLSLAIQAGKSLEKKCKEVQS